MSGRNMKLRATNGLDRLRDRWLVGGIGVAGAVLVLASARMTGLPEAPRARGPDASESRFPAPGLVLTRADAARASDALGERLRLFDPTPLFLPVDRGGFVSEPEGLREAGGGEAVRLFPPRLRYEEARELVARVRPSVPVLAQAAAELAGPRWFEGMARTVENASTEAMRRATARVKMLRIGAGDLVVEKLVTLPDDLADAGGRPMRLMVLVDEVGEVGLPSILAGSGAEGVDERIRALAGRDWVPAARLRPGIYRLEISL